MSKHMWRDVLALQSGVDVCRCRRVLGEQVGDPVARQRLSLTIDEHALLIRAVRHPAKPVQRAGGLGPYRQEPLLLALASQAYLPRRDQVQVIPAHSCRLAYPRAAVVQEQQQRVVTPSVVRSLVGHADDQASIGWLQVGGRALAGLLRRDGQHPHVLLGMRQVIAQHVLEESAYCGAPAIARGSAVRPRLLDMIQEAYHRVGIEIAQLQAGDATTAPFGDELQQQRQRIAVGANRMCAGTALSRQVLGEVRLQLSEQTARSRAAHGGRRLSRTCCSKRWLASSSSCGVALR
jgi:hypothetical protein